MATRKALIVGASGLIGGYCLQALLEDQDYIEVIALVRKPILTTHRKLRVVITPFTDLEQILASTHAQDVFCCLGTTIKKAGSQEAFKQIDFSLVVTIAELMKNQGAKQFVVISSIGADKTSKAFYSRIKGAMEEALKEIGYDCLRIIRPSLLLGEREEFRFGEKVAIILTPLLKPFLMKKFKKYAPIQAELVGRFMVKVGKSEPNTGIHVYESDKINCA